MTLSQHPDTDMADLLDVFDREFTIENSVEDLTYDRTVDRHKVHRAAVSEVFLTDIRQQTAQHVLVAAQLPSSHSFFHDSIYNNGEGTPDALLLLEIARQAAIASIHEVGVDAGNTLISNEIGLKIYPYEIAALDPEDTNLLIRNYFDWTSIRHGVPRSCRCYQQLIIGNRVIAKHFGSGRILTKNQLQALRSEYRGTPPPTTANLHELTFTDVQDPIAPERVGRRNPLNVVISQLNTTETPSAQVTPNVANKALFDHAYDHITMQILTEAARQLYLATRPDSEHAPEIYSIRGNFLAFAELDSPVQIRAIAPGEFVVEQDNRQIADFALKS